MTSSRIASVPGATSPRKASTRRARRIRVVLAGLTAVSAVWAAVDGTGAVDLRTPAFGGNPSQDLGLLAVVLAAALAMSAGWALLVVLERWTANPGRTWLVAAIAALAASLGGPFSGTGIDTAQRWLLVLLHVVVAIVFIPSMYRTAGDS